MNCISITVCAVFLMLTLCSASTEAAVSNSGSLQSADLKRPVQQGSKTSYFDLFRELFPDLRTDSTHDDAAIAHRSVPIRKIDDERESIVLESDIEIKSFDSRWIKSEGKRLLLLSVELSAEDANEATPYEGEATVLALFSLEPSELLDAMDIKTDRFTGFWEDHSLVHLNSRNDAFVIYSTHGNAGESYNDLALMFVDDGRFKVISSLFLFNTQGCGVTFTESPYFRALPAVGRKYPKILVMVRLKKDADTDGCDRRTRGYTRYYHAIYYWKQAKTQYESYSRQLEKLDRFNRERL